MIVPLLSACVAASSAVTACQDDRPLGPRLQAQVVSQRDTALAPVADTYIRQGSPNQNQGAEPELRIQSTGHNRVLMRWDQSALAQAVGGGSLVSARLELTIVDNADNWGTTGRTLDLHRLTQAWTESGSTWNCAVDGNPGNQSADCSGATAWEMGSPASANPWIVGPTATTTITNGQSGVVTLDVTGDVEAYLSGSQANYGWLLKKTQEGQNGRVEFGSRDGLSGGRLVLTVGQASDTARPIVPSVTNYPRDTLFVVQNPSDTERTYYRRLVAVMFSDTAAGGLVNSFLARYGAEIVAGIPVTGSYIVRMSDPGTTWDSVNARLLEMRAEAGVLSVMLLTRRDVRPELRGRFPKDGATRPRESWFDSTQTSTWAQRAVGAPQAWGCECGIYSSSRVRVGILEWRFDGAFFDLGPSQPALFAASSNPGVTESQQLVTANERHGSAMAGILAAQGDNGEGVAGMMWRADLKLYALGIQNLQSPDSYLLAFLQDVLPRMIADKPRVVSVSTAFGGSPGDSAEQSQLMTGLARLFRESAGTLIVVSTGNNDTTVTVNQYLALQPRSLGFDAALLRLARDSGFGDRILFVAGTMRGNQRWRDPNGDGRGSLFIRGAVELAAPAESVETLGHASSGEATIRVTGTSSAAPMVAGVAAQLLAMDPSLTPGEVKTYLFRGAAEAYRDALGAQVLPAPLDGFDATLFQLHAYRSLRLLSLERPGTPICGFPVSLGVTDEGGYENTLVLERATPQSFPVPGAHSLVSFSVAQGGRLIAVHDIDVPENGPVSYRSILLDHQGQPAGTVPALWRHYLERDTADESTDRPNAVFTLRPADGSPETVLDPISVAAGALGTTTENCFGFARIAPDATHAALSLDCFDGSGKGGFVVDTSGLVVRQVAGPSGQLLWGVQGLAWSHDSRRAVFAVLADVRFDDPDPPYSLVVLTDHEQAIDSAPVPGRSVLLMRFTGDDAAVLGDEREVAEGGICQVVARSSLNLASAAPTPLLCPRWGATVQQFANVRAVLSSSSGQGPPVRIPRRRSR